MSTTPKHPRFCEACKFASPSVAPKDAPAPFREAFARGACGYCALRSSGAPMTASLLVGSVAFVSGGAVAIT